MLMIIAGSLHRACASGKILSTLRFVLNSPRLINEENREGHTPLFLAVNNNHALVIAVLLEAGVNVCQLNHLVCDNDDDGGGVVVDDDDDGVSR